MECSECQHVNEKINKNQFKTMKINLNQLDQLDDFRILICIQAYQNKLNPFLFILLNAIQLAIRTNEFFF